MSNPPFEAVPASEPAQLKDLPSLIAGVIDSLKAFEERRTRAVESSADQALQFGAVRDAIDDLVRSVQFHDITRQQIEHVMQAVEQVRSECDSRRGRRNSLPVDARAILALQSSQLSEAARVFASSVQAMERDLDNIAARVKDMAETSRQLMGISADDHGSFFLRMEGQFTAILKMLSNSSTAHAGMESTAGVLEETVGAMGRSVAEIRGVEIRIRRIATNATIQAAHLGPAGDALSVIAGVMQNLALESNTNTEDVGQALDAMGEAARRVSGDPGRAASAGASANDDITREMGTVVVELHSSSESAFSRVNQIAALGTQLAGDIEAVRGGFSAGELFAQIVAQARGDLETIAAQAGEGAEAVSAEMLESHAKRYTMQMERDVHQAVAQGSTIDASAPAEALLATQPVAQADSLPTIVSKDGDLGDNVELF